MHAATLQAFEGQPPVTLRIVIEGEEETDSHLAPFVESHPDMFTADVFVIADSGNDVVGHPIVCTDLRGVAAVTVEVKTLDQAVHSGMFGGVAPDALLALIRMLATLHDDAGDVAIPQLVGRTLGRRRDRRVDVSHDGWSARRRRPGRYRFGEQLDSSVVLRSPSSDSTLRVSMARSMPSSRTLVRRFRYVSPRPAMRRPKWQCSSNTCGMPLHGG